MQPSQHTNAVVTAWREHIERLEGRAAVLNGLALDAVLTVASGGVGTGGVEELAPGHGDQPPLRVARWVVRPPADGLDQRHEPIVLAGFSMGGYVAWQIALNHANRLRGLVLCDTRAAADAEDAVQETFLKVHRAARTWNGASTGTRTMAAPAVCSPAISFPESGAGAFP